VPLAEKINRKYIVLYKRIRMGAFFVCQGYMRNLLVRKNVSVFAISEYEIYHLK
jgi:hypothetical protein